MFCRAVRVSEGAFACMAHKRPAASPVDNRVNELGGCRYWWSCWTWALSEQRFLESWLRQSKMMTRTYKAQRPQRRSSPVLPANFYINVQQMLHNYICCNIKAQQMLQFVLFDLWSFRSKCWTIYIDYKHSVAAAFIMALIACWISFFREF